MRSLSVLNRRRLTSYGALQRFGFLVEQDRASELVDVDFLVGEDGQPQAVRLHQDTELVAVKQ